MKLGVCVQQCDVCDKHYGDVLKIMMLLLNIVVFVLNIVMLVLKL